MYCDDYHFEPHVSPFSEEASLTDAHIMSRMIFFVNLVTTGSISYAAERMGISVSSGSLWLSNLEKEIGSALYRRNNKAIPLTDAGAHLYRNFCLISEKISMLKSELTQFSSQPRGTFRICCLSVYAEKYFMPVVANYMVENRQVNISVNVSAFGIKNWKESDIIVSALNALNHQQGQDISLGRLVALFKRLKTSEWLLNIYCAPANEITERIMSFKNYLIEQHNKYFPWVYDQVVANEGLHYPV